MGRVRLPLGAYITSPTEWRDCDDVVAVYVWNVAREGTIKATLMKMKNWYKEESILQLHTQKWFWYIHSLGDCELCRKISLFMILCGL